MALHFWPERLMPFPIVFASARKKKKETGCKDSKESGLCRMFTSHRKGGRYKEKNKKRVRELEEFAIPRDPTPRAICMSIKRKGLPTEEFG
jgi:hypothetical protein